MQRPTSALVFGILNLVFAAIGLLQAGRALLHDTRAQLAQIAQVDREVARIAGNPSYLTLQKTINSGAVAAAGIIALAGVGLLLMKNWGRALSIVWAVYSILASIVGGVATYLLFTAPYAAHVAKTQLAGQPEVAATVAKVLSLIASVVAILVAIAYPVVLIVFMRRKKFIAAFNVQPIDAEVVARSESPFQSP